MYLSNLAALCIAGALNLIRASLGKGDAEQAKSVIISSFDIHMCLNQSLPLPHQRSKLVGGKIHALKRFENSWEMF